MCYLQLQKLQEMIVSLTKLSFKVLLLTFEMDSHKEKISRKLDES